MGSSDSGDSSDTEKLIEEHIESVCAKARAYAQYRPTHDVHAYESGAAEALWRAAKRWRPGGKAAFSTYLHIAIRRAFLEVEAREAAAQARVYAAGGLSSGVVPMDPLGQGDGGEVVEQPQSDRRARQSAARLGYIARAMQADGRGNYSSIARQLGRSYSYVMSCVKKSKKISDLSAV